ncbi:hypothetical protein ACFYNY_17595 [Streptomyces sp. NPDC006530]|uniref:hypothetical protein n=1 Tax=Streptomyces sp. NPDC006530 TaxID=3364750 RepID=UPI0036A2524A
MFRTPLTNGFLRTASAAAHLRLFVLVGVVTVLVTRAFLALTGYPKLGGGAGNGGLHISHMLWGGLLMLAGLLVMLVFTGAASRRRGAVAGGVGFGLFIDEVGKLVATDGYFYRPAPGIIYLTFVALTGLAWWVTRMGRADRAASGTTRAASAADTALQGILCGLSAQDRSEALDRLRAGGAPTAELDKALVALLEAVPECPAPRPHPYDAALRRAYAWLVTQVSGTRGLIHLVAWGTTLQAVVLLVGVASEGLTGGLAGENQWAAIAGAFACSLASLVLSVRGTALLRRDTNAALRTLRAALLVDLLLGQVFKFTINQFSGVAGWLISLALLSVLSLQVTHRQAVRTKASGSLAATRQTV